MRDLATVAAARAHTIIVLHPGGAASHEAAEAAKASTAMALAALTAEVAAADAVVEARAVARSAGEPGGGSGPGAMLGERWRWARERFRWGWGKCVRRAVAACGQQDLRCVSWGSYGLFVMHARAGSAAQMYAAAGLPAPAQHPYQSVGAASPTAATAALFAPSTLASGPSTSSGSSTARSGSSTSITSSSQGQQQQQLLQPHRPRVLFQMPDEVVIGHDPVSSFTRTSPANVGGSMQALSITDASVIDR